MTERLVSDEDIHRQIEELANAIQKLCAGFPTELVMGALGYAVTRIIVQHYPRVGHNRMAKSWCAQVRRAVALREDC